MILIDENDVIIDIAPTIIEDVDYFRVKKLDDILYMKNGLLIVEVEPPQKIKPQKYKFVDGDFILNENYKDPDAIIISEDEILNPSHERELVNKDAVEAQI